MVRRNRELSTCLGMSESGGCVQFPLPSGAYDGVGHEMVRLDRDPFQRPTPMTISPIGIMVSPGYPSPRFPYTTDSWMYHPLTPHPKEATAGPTQASHMRRQTEFVGHRSRDIQGPRWLGQPKVPGKTIGRFRRSARQLCLVHLMAPRTASPDGLFIVNPDRLSSAALPGGF
jgi:hypothetical protein